MTPSDYIKNALRTEPSSYLFQETNGVSPRVEHAAIGAVTEAGELMNAIKRAKIYGKTLDRVNLVEEAGDVMWYLAILADDLGVSFEEIWEKNIAKLRQRFPDKYSDEHCLNRDIEAERKILEG
jgi:NTP pyrophosphatase (non-canonical NTP hydrolase)